MVKIRPTTEQDRQALKAAVRRLLPMAGGVSAFEKVTRVNASTLSRYGAPDEAINHMPIDVAMDLMLDTRSNGIVSIMAAQLGYKLVSLGNQNFGNTLPDIGDMSRLSKSVSDVMQEYAQAIADGSITPREKQQIDIEIEEAVQILRAFQRKVDGALSKGGDA
ncbi:phage regulatory CII family protein [Pseudochrobactrum lubricantis]|uniref:phage regulatory CII family protein n=1 Tax=Pseudochrobactrum lubricantis TaxID=558172 RepID=UPI0035D90BC2